MTTLVDNLRWYLERLDDEPYPERLHVRGVWADAQFGYGSRLGSPALHPEFERWLMLGESSVVAEQFSEPCRHPGMTEADRASGVLCWACGVRDANGRVVSESGIATGTRYRYRWPMRSALSRMRKCVVRKGRPDLGSTLYQVASSGGDLRAAQQALAARWVSMGDPDTALAHIALALNRVRTFYRESPPPSPLRPKSDAQLDAEAVA